MKTILDRFFIIIVTLFGVMSTIAAPTPPSPGAKKPPPPPGLPIDENIFIGLTIAILLGIYIVYKYQLKTKAPI